MFKILIAILFCLSAGFASSQTIINIIPPQNSEEDYKLEKISDTAFVEIGHSDDMGMKYGFYCRLKLKVPDGEYLFYSHNVLESRSFIKNSKKDSIWTVYYSDGSLKSVTPYKNGMINGEVVSYFFSGNISAKATYVDNKFVGEVKNYYESGIIRSVYYFGDGECVRIEMYNQNGELAEINIPERLKKDIHKLNNQKMENVRFVNITNAKIAYKEFGSGEPLIMCIGYGANMDLWSPGVIDMLKEKYRVIVFDYRGMGYSTNTDSAFTINTLAEDLNELMNVLKIENADFLGWSMGGFVAQMFAVNHSEKVKKLILYASNCGGIKTINPSEEIIKILANPSPSPMDLIGTLFPDKWLKENREPWKSLPFPTEPFNTKTIVQQYIAVQEWLSPGGGSAEQLNKLNMPVLLICGNEDKVVPYENISILSELIKSSRLTVINDSGHGLMYQMPVVFAKNVLSFLGE